MFAIALALVSVRASPSVNAVLVTPVACHATGVGQSELPDPRCTPGAINAAVDQANIGSTICVGGWTEHLRPPEAYTERLKRLQMRAYGEPGSAANYEEDHLIPLELGGSAAGPANLWPEPGASPNTKDNVEQAARIAVCDHLIKLSAAQSAIAANWVRFGSELRVFASPSTSSSGSTPSVEPAGAKGSPSPLSRSGHYYRAGEYCPRADLNLSISDPFGHLRCLPTHASTADQPVWVDVPT